MFDRLDDLREKIRVRYRGQLQDLLEEQQPSLGIDDGNADMTDTDRPAF